MDSAVPEPPQHVQEKRLGANVRPLSVDTLVTFSKVSWFYITSQTRCSYTQSDHSAEAEGDRTPRAVAKHSSYQQLEQKRYR